ncbi:MAG: hypothetical protein BZY81_06365 [SAR202 cluster bacterium Io17-Chloro-G4]|nr:MAG: hypothetical protein BZY81_06365 [SAR202 cluster bacterium Io17-Chloro-G4]
MSLDVLITVAATSFIQSIFGVGVLLFGTPLLLLNGHNFIEAVAILLPISLLINLSQIAKDLGRVDLDFYKSILVYTIPFVVIFLLAVTALTINIGIIVGILLLFVAAKDYYHKANKVIDLFVRYEKAYFSIMGIIHGLTNLGGSLLTAIVHTKGYDKRITRATVAASYATFATFQILTLLVSGYVVDFNFSAIGIYMILGMTIFVITEKIVYTDITTENYRRFFAVFLFVSGVLLCVKSI